MSTFEFDKNAFDDIIDKSIFTGFNLLHEVVLDSVPRDKNNLPNPIILKNKSKPERNIRKNNKHYYRKPVMINWQWYEWVTGNLARSIWTQKLWIWEYIVWVRQWPTEDYWYTQEYWDSNRWIPSRSFLNKPLRDNSKEILKQTQKTFSELLNKH